MHKLLLHQNIEREGEERGRESGTFSSSLDAEVLRAPTKTKKLVSKEKLEPFFMFAPSQ
jgi:hypothetical protein